MNKIAWRHTNDRQRADVLPFRCRSGAAWWNRAEQRACAGNVQRYCCPILDPCDFAVLGCLQTTSGTTHGGLSKGLSRSRPVIDTRGNQQNVAGTIAILDASLGAATFLRIIRISCVPFPSAIHDHIPLHQTSAFFHTGPPPRSAGALFRDGYGNCDWGNGRDGVGQSSSCEESGA
jgi:hypothetical protein